MVHLKKTGLNLETLRGLSISERMTSPSARALSQLQDGSSIAKMTKNAYSLIAECNALGFSQRGVKSASRALAADVEMSSAQFLGKSMTDLAIAHSSGSSTPYIDLQIAEKLFNQSKHIGDAIKEFEASFRLPQVMEANKLIGQMRLNADPFKSFKRQWLSELRSQQDLAASMSRPWMHEFSRERSMNALMELQGLGLLLRSTQGFDKDFTKAFRLDFGDWRDRITFSKVVIEDAAARTALYIERGFDSSLADFPDAAFREVLARVGLDEDNDDGADLPETMRALDAIEQESFKRANKCHDYLQRLERRLRQFIDKAMTSQYGPDWANKKLHPRMRDDWEDRKLKAESAGKALEMLIDVADFTDYETIICKKDHWREVFQPYFRRPESVRESLQRLRPIRLATMHARFVTREDLLYVLAETTRLVKAFDRFS